MKILTIIGSTRPNRATDRVAKWVATETNTVEGIEFETLDLNDYQLPFFDEPVSPRYNPERKPNQAAQQILSKLEKADGFIVVTPEYNHSFPAVLKNMFDYIAYEVKRKPFVIVSHGTVGGARAAEHLKLVINEVQAVAIPAFVAVVGLAAYTFDEDGNLTNEALANDPYGPVPALKGAIEEIVWYTKVLANARLQA